MNRSDFYRQYRRMISKYIDGAFFSEDRIELTEVFRQSDEAFVNILNDVRRGFVRVWNQRLLARSHAFTEWLLHERDVTSISCVRGNHT